MQVAIFSDDYYLFYGMSQLLIPFEGIEVINLYSPAGGRMHAVYCHADMVIVSFSSICRIMNFLSHIIDRPDHAIVLTGVETPRLSNFNCLKKHRVGRVHGGHHVVCCKRQRAASVVERDCGIGHAVGGKTQYSYCQSIRHFRENRQPT